VTEETADVVAPIEPPHVHHPVGHRGIDLVVPIAALFVSLVSILIAWYSATVEAQMARQNERMVQASSLPRLSQSITTLTRTNGLNRVTFALANEGVGPAEIRSAIIMVRGLPVRNAVDLLKQYDIPGGHLTLAPLTNAMLRPGQELVYFDLDADPSIARQVDRMIKDLRGHQIEVRLCYGSVFDEYWTLGGPNLRPQRVAQCPIARVPYE
jgi:hypothetical protein